jgi:hypothetical protein
VPEGYDGVGEGPYYRKTPPGFVKLQYAPNWVEQKYYTYTLIETLCLVQPST